MISQRILRAPYRNSHFLSLSAITRNGFRAPSSILLARYPNIKSRPTSTTSNPENASLSSSDASTSILAAQRLRRPTSPHLSVYRPQVTWILSGLNRITGSILSGSLYLFSTAYVVAPLFGWHLESASIAAAFATWPVAAKVITKFLVSLPFSFHSWNGIRHLVWDTGMAFSNKRVQQTGWAVVGLTVVSSGILAYM